MTWPLKAVILKGRGAGRALAAGFAAAAEKRTAPTGKRKAAAGTLRVASLAGML
jgi:hypothetical protein